MLESILLFTLASTTPVAEPMASRSVLSGPMLSAQAVPAQRAIAVVEPTDAIDASATASRTDAMQLHAPPHAYLMVEALRRGGLVLFVRHGITSLDNADHQDVAIADCKTQRSLSTAGRALATEVGNAVKELHLPIGPVFTSAYCRCRETADLMFGNGLRVADLAVDERSNEGAGARLLSVMARMPTYESNTVIVGHLLSAVQVYGVMPDEGEVLVLDPRQRGHGPALIGHITATQWSDIVRDYRQYGNRITEMVSNLSVGEDDPPGGPDHTSH